MTISTDIASTGPYTPNGVTTVFAFDFQAGSATEVGVIVGDAVLDSDDYTVTLEADRTGSVTISPALDAIDGNIYIFSEPLFEQSADFQRFGPYFPDTLNPHLDHAAIRDIYLKDQATRSIKAPVGGNGTTLAPGSTGVLGVLDGDITLLDIGLLGIGIIDFTTNAPAGAEVFDFGMNAAEDAEIIDFGD